MVTFDHITMPSKAVYTDDSLKHLKLQVLCHLISINKQVQKYAS